MSDGFQLDVRLDCVLSGVVLRWVIEMTITTDQAIALAREVAPRSITAIGVSMTDEELTAFANAVRKQTLLEAAEWFDKDAGCLGMDSVQTVAAVNLRRMAGVE